MRRLLRSLAPVAMVACALLGAAPAGGQVGLPRLFGPTVDAMALPHSLHDAAAQSRAVRPDVAAIEQLARLHLATGPRARFVLDFFPDVDLEAEVVAAEVRATGSTVFARLPGIELGSALLTYESGVLVVSANMPRASYYVDRRPDGLYHVARVAEHLLGTEAPPIAVATPASPADDTRAQDIPADSGRLVDILVVWTPAAQAAAGGVAAIEAIAQASVDHANLVFLNSGVAHRLRLVHRQQVAYTEPSPNSYHIVIDHLVNPNDGQLDEVHALRDAHGADLAALLAVYTSGPNGIANMPVPPTAATSGQAFSVTAWNHAIPAKVFVHEVGHNFGANHDPFAATFGLAFPYSQGYIDFDTGWRTVMSYPDHCLSMGIGCPRVDYFSNPNLTYGDAPMGTPSTQNNAHTLNKTAKIIASYRASVYPIPQRFTDVAASHPFHGYIEFFGQAGVTTGCGNGAFCPDASVSRNQMAVFIERIKRASNWTPQPAGNVFTDVPASDPFAAWIEALYNDDITGGCNAVPLMYCPGTAVTRGQMAVFVLRATCGAGFVPGAPALQRFGDVPPSHAFYAFIDRFATLGITSGCGGGNFCPETPVTRGQMAVFIERAFPFLTPSDACAP